MKQVLCLFLALGTYLPTIASAQWAWTDADGRKVFSDRAPPPNVPEKSVFKRPASATTLAKQATTANEQADTRAPATAAQPGVSSPRASGVDKELAERKKKEEQTQAAQRKADEDRLSKAKADNCERAKRAKMGIDSGVRMGRLNAQGEREIMDDAARAAEAKRVQSLIESECQ
jgi:hypothetical protein